MQPSYNYQTTPTNNYTPQQIRVQKFLKVSAVVVVLVGIAMGAFLAYYTRTFHIISTTPSTNNVATIAPDITVNFSQPLSPKGIALHMEPNVIGSYSVNNKALTITFASNVLLKSNTTYTLTIESISDTVGKTLTNQTLQFKPKSENFNKLSKDQQQTILQQQSKQPSSVSTITFAGTSNLIGIGASTIQVSDFEQAVYNFSTSTKKTIHEATVSNVQPVWQDPNNPTTSLTVTLTLQIDNTTYNATLTMPDLTSAQLTITDRSTGSTVYQSSLIAVDSTQ